MDAADREALIETVTGILGAVAEERATITYQDLLARLARELPADGPLSLPVLLREISTREHEQGRPLLSAVVVRPSGVPGGGFFRLAGELGRTGSDRRSVWADEVSRVYEVYAGDPR